jgi:hypothetical protein
VADLNTAELPGRRVAEITARLHPGSMRLSGTSDEVAHMTRPCGMAFRKEPRLASEEEIRVRDPNRAFREEIDATARQLSIGAQLTHRSYQ